MNKDLPQLITYNSIQPFEGKSITVNEKEALNIFPVKRIYWIKYFADEITYSEHAHKSLRQIIIAIEGKVDIQLKSIDEATYHFTLDDSSKGLYIPPMFWKKIEYIKPCNLMCLASKEFDEYDYIRNYEDFKNFQK
ncbi:MAG: FdtA/QdtA family cupin domain-containing protein [Chitinophagales bacterium]